MPLLEEFGNQYQQYGSNDIVLFLKRQRPGVQERFEFSGCVEVTRLHIEKYVGQKQTICDRAAREVAKVLRFEEKISNYETYCDSRDARGQYSTHASLIKADYGKLVLGKFPNDDRCNEESGYDKENIDAHITTADDTKARVVKHDREDCYGTQAVYIGSVCWSCHGCSKEGDASVTA